MQLAELGALFAGFAHEIRNPLSTIGLNLQLVKEEFGNDEDPRDKRVRRRIGVVEGEVKRLQGVLEQFLGFVRVPELELEEVSLESLIEDLAEFTRPELEEKDITLRTFVDGAAPKVWADPAQLRAVLVNLVRNAAEAMDEPGQVMLTLRAAGRSAEDQAGEGQRPGAEGDTGQAAAARGVVIQVTDTGAGMTAEVREHAFDPYFSTKKAGTGLGLPTVRRIIEQHDGSIELASDVGKGSQFTIRLPQKPRAAEAMADDGEPRGDA